MTSPSLRLLAAALTLLLAPALHAGKPQQLTSPDQVPEGLGKSDWSSIRAAHEGWKHQIHAVEGGWQARNPGQQWTTRFNGRGFLSTPKDADWTWGLEFQSYGFGDRQTRVSGTPEVRADGQRITYQWSDTVEEWFVNDGRGLEHGFTIAERPAGSRENEALVLTLVTRGPLKPSLSADRQTVHFRDAATAPVLNYSGLKVWDADGTVLPSRFQVVGSLVRLLVEESTARYPITIDPIAQQAFLKASNTEAGDYFGIRVAVSGDTVVVGAYQEDSSTMGVNSTPNENARNSGAAYVFTRSGTTWSQQAYLKASNISSGGNFGFSVAVSGDTVVVGAISEDSSTTGVNSTPNESALNSGAAYVFTRSGTTWSQQAYLKASNTGASDQFGVSVAVSGDTVVVGAVAEDSSTTGVNSTSNNGASDSGSVYVFARSGTTWSQQAYLKASNTGANDYFGIRVAVSGDTVVVGAYGESSSTTEVNSTPNENAGGSGATYVFTRSGTTWSQQAYLKAFNTGTGDNFGWSVAVSGDTVVVGARQEASSTTGVNSTPNENASSSGAAYIFARSGTTWSQQAYLKASNTGTGDVFGYSVAVSGDTVVVGAYAEASSTTGVNSTPNDSAANAGAAYVFTRSGTTWSQQAYLKASNTGADDQFGWSVAVSGDTVVVGASREDSSTTGVNSTPDESASVSGAAYIFTGLGPPPLLELVSPPTGSRSGGTTLTITGSNFTGASSVLIGGIPATSFTVNSATSITATTPAHPPGIVDVEVTTPIGTATGSDLFTFLGREIAVEQPSGNDLTSGTSTVDFGGVLTNAPASRTFVIRNTGNVPLGELAVSIGGTHDVEFVAVQPPGTVNGGGSTTFTVTFTPAANGLRSATLLIASDDENEDPFEIALIGTGSTAQQLLDGYATSAGLSGLDAEPGAMPYKDGVPNLLKYAFNMNAAGPDRRTLTPGTGTEGLPVLRIVSGTLRYEFLRRKNSGLTYTPLQSSSLNPNAWQTPTGTEIISSIDDTWERVVLEQPLLPGGARFFAMRVGIE